MSPTDPHRVAPDPPVAQGRLAAPALTLPTQRRPGGTAGGGRHRHVSRPPTPVAVPALPVTKAPPTTPLYAATVLVTTVWVAVVWAAPLVQVGPGVRQLALLGHLVALAVGFGAVLAVDWFGLLWVLRRRSLATVLQVAQGVHPLIWLGLTGLVASGALLSPDTSAPLTRLKLAAVLVVAINGLFVDRLRQRLSAYGEHMPPLPVLARASATALISQLCWWTALVVGFLNAQA